MNLLRLIPRPGRRRETPRIGDGGAARPPASARPPGTAGPMSAPTPLYVRSRGVRAPPDRSALEPTACRRLFSATPAAHDLRADRDHRDPTRLGSNRPGWRFRRHRLFRTRRTVTWDFKIVLDLRPVECRQGAKRHPTHSSFVVDCSGERGGRSTAPSKPGRAPIV
jgi:hypothetical protein